MANKFVTMTGLVGLRTHTSLLRRPFQDAFFHCASREVRLASGRWEKDGAYLFLVNDR
jgi:hypothetical protein